MTFEEYARIVDGTLARHWAITEARVTSKEVSPAHGVVQGEIVLLDGSYVDFSEEILIVANAIVKKGYRYQYVKNEQPFFRYDNYPNHPGLRPPYYHQHSSNQSLVHLEEAPTLIDVLEEALRYMF